MIIKKAHSLRSIYRFTGQHLLWLVPWMMAITVVYRFTHCKFIILPWLPLSLIGTAVAFFVGFKNNQSYGRLWEARKIWGAIVNYSRMFGTMVKHYYKDEATSVQNNPQRKQLIYRHIAYIYQFRHQLLEPMPWEHVRLSWIFGSYNRLRQKKLLDANANDLKMVSVKSYLSVEEADQLHSWRNAATQLLDKQTEDVQRLYQKNLINMIQQTSLQEIINGLYEEQGKAERIKKFPFPRQYAGYSFVFVCIFVFLLPFSIVGEFSKLGDSFVWLSVPVGVVVGWIYVVMEMIGDYSENPFEGLPNDIPLLSICRTIEIDLLQMIGDNHIPDPIHPKNDILI